MSSRYATFRRVVAPIALIAAIGLIAWDTCNKQEREPTRFALDLGDRAAQVRHVRIDLWVDTTSLGFFERSFEPGTAPRAVRFTQPVSQERVELTAAVTFADGEIQTLRRVVRPPPGGEVVVELPAARAAPERP